MGDRRTVRLPGELARALGAAAASTHRTNSEIVRQALRDDLGLNGAEVVRPADRVGGLLGALESGTPDLASCSRHFLLDSIRRGA